MPPILHKQNDNTKYNRINQIYEMLKNNVHGITITELSKELDGNGDLSEFIDSTAISDYAVEGVKKLTNAGIMQGSDNMFRPADNATRAEAASVIYMIAEYLK